MYFIYQSSGQRIWNVDIAFYLSFSIVRKKSGWLMFHLIPIHSVLFVVYLNTPTGHVTTSATGAICCSHFRSQRALQIRGSPGQGPTSHIHQLNIVIQTSFRYWRNRYSLWWGLVRLCVHSCISVEAKSAELVQINPAFFCYASVGIAITMITKYLTFLVKFHSARLICFCMEIFGFARVLFFLSLETPFICPSVCILHPFRLAYFFFIHLQRITLCDLTGCRSSSS